MKYKLTMIILLVYASIYSQGRYNNMTSHQKGNMSIDASARLGANNQGINAMAGYYMADYFAIRAGATYRKFKYNSYKENILEANIEGAYTVLNPKYDSRFFGNFNVVTLLGVAYENVKVTSTTTLIDPYPKYYYIYGGAQVEYTPSDKIGIVASFRQYYAVNGSEETLGNWRYDYGLGVRFYLWGKY